MAAVCGRGLYSQQPVEKKRGGVRGTHTAPLLGPFVSPPPPSPAPLPGDEWWYLLKVKPAGEPWLRPGSRGRLLGRSRGQTQQKAALQSPMYSTKTAGPLLAHNHKKNLDQIDSLSTIKDSKS